VEPENESMASKARHTLLALGFAALAAGAALPAAAAPVLSGSAGLQVAADDSVIAVRAERKVRKHHRHRHQVNRQQWQGSQPYAYGWQGPDTVGSLGYDGYGYAYNRFSGQRYQSCVFDEGYGRTRPCDAGGGGGGRN
jgi:hypothetical protein